jgi:outer membrane lipoprotein-sorting protein
MNRKRTLSVGLVAVLIAGTAALAPAQTAQEILGKMIDAQGGRKALEAIKDSTYVGALELVQFGMSGTLTMYQKEPDRMRLDMEISGMIVTQAFDGEKAWGTNPQTFTTEEIAGKQGEDIRRQALGNGSLLFPEKYGITFTAKGKEKIGDKEYLVLEQAFKDGPPTTWSIDPATYLPYKTKTQTVDMMGADVLAESVLEDYKKVGETLVAHRMTIFQNGAEFIRMTFSGVTYNSGIEDSIFKMTR